MQTPASRYRPGSLHRRGLLGTFLLLGLMSLALAPAPFHPPRAALQPAPAASASRSPDAVGAEIPLALSLPRAESRGEVEGRSVRDFASPASNPARPALLGGLAPRSPDALGTQTPPVLSAVEGLALSPESPPGQAYGIEGRSVRGAPETALRASYGRLPLSFEANQGQTDPRVKFLSRGRGYTLFLTPTEAVLVLRQGSPTTGKPTETFSPRPQAPASGETTPGVVAAAQAPVASSASRSPDAVGAEIPLALSEVEGRSVRDSASVTPSAVEGSAASVSSASVVRLRLLGANPAPRITGLDPLPGTSNYFIGNDPAQWRTNLPTFARVRYQNLYPGIDLIYYGQSESRRSRDADPALLGGVAPATGLEFDFVVSPGADPSLIRLAIDGADQLALDSDGNLSIRPTVPGSRFPVHDVRLRKPRIYQEINGVRHQIPGRFVLNSSPHGPQAAGLPRSRRAGQGEVVGHESPNTVHGSRITDHVGFELGPYDPTKPLIIDPVLLYSTYLGGSGDDAAVGIALDAAGNVYIAGRTTSTDLPTANPPQPTLAGGLDAFVTKLNPSGSALLYSTYLGGSANDIALAIAVDASGNVYLTGRTDSTNFPTTTGAFQTLFGGTFDAFVTKLNATGSQLLYSTYLGGAGNDLGFGVAVDAAAKTYVTGQTASANFPTLNAVQPALNGLVDAFVAKIDPTASGAASLIYSTYLGGSANDTAPGIAVDAAGNAYVAGSASLGFPTTTGAFQTVFGGVSDAFVTKLNATGSTLVYSTFLGGSGQEEARGIAVDAAGNAYVTGFAAVGFPTTTGAFQTTFGGGIFDAFVTKLNPAGSALLYSTYLGGSGSDRSDLNGLAVDAAGNAYVSGLTGSTNFPTANPFQAAFGGGNSDAFVTKLNAAGSGLVYSTYLGGSFDDSGTGLALDPVGNTYVTGFTNSTDFPTTSRAFQAAFGGGVGVNDAFVTKLPAVIAGGANPQRALKIPNRAEIYVSNPTGGIGQTVSVISTVTNTVLATISVGNDTPDALAVSPDGSRVFVGQLDGDIRVIDTAARIVTTTLLVGSPVRDIALTPDGSKLYVAMESLGLKMVLTATNAVSTISTTPCPEGVAVSPDGTRLYVNYQCGGPGGTSGHDAIGVFDTATDTLLTSITSTAAAPFANVGSAIAISPNGAQVWENGGDACSNLGYDGVGCPPTPGRPEGVVNVITTATNSLARSLGFTLAEGAGFISFFPDSSRALVGGSNLKIIDTSTFAVVEKLDLPASGSVAFINNGARGYAPLSSLNLVAILKFADSAAPDFSSTSNPNGNWSYGWSATRGGVFDLYTVMGQPFAVGLDTWHRPSGTLPAVSHNGTDSGIGGGIPGELSFHPGSVGENSVVRWTAPASGLYKIAVTFKGLDPLGTTTDVAVLHGATELFSAFVTGFGATQSFSATRSVLAGETIDFTVGYGVNGNLYDTTGLDATITLLAAAGAPSADLALTKTDSPDPVTVNTNLTYTLTVTNSGPDAATGVTLSDTLPTGVTFVSASSTLGTCSGTTTAVTCALGTLASAATATVTIVVTPTTAVTLTNSASVSATETDPNPANNTATATTTVSAPAADLAVTKVDLPDPVTVGNTLTYRLTVTNNGPATATGVTLSDTLPASVSFVSSSTTQGTCSGTTTITCALGSLSNLATATVTLVVTPTASGTLTNTASVSATETDLNTANNTATAITIANAPVCLTPPAGLVSWWPGDGTASDIADSNPGTLVGGATFAPGKVGQAFSFDGVGSVTMATSPSVSPLGSWTYDFWINVNTFSNGGAFDGNGSYFLDRVGETANLASLKAIGGQFGFQIRFDSGAGADAAVGGTITPGIWQHIGMVREFGVAFRLYLNGQLVASIPDAASSLTLPTPRLGHHNQTALAGFVGLMDEVEIYNRALSATEITALFTAGSAGKCTTVNPAPSLTSMSPTSTAVRGAGFTLTVNGSNFISGSVVRWNGSDRTTTFVSSTQLTASILSTDIASAGRAQVTVFNPLLGGGLSNALTFIIDPAATPIVLAPFNTNYSAFTLGTVPGVPVSYGGLTFKVGDPNTLLIGGNANSFAGKLYAITVIRDPNNHVIGFTGTASVFADAANNDGGVAYGPGDVLFLARYPNNEVGQTKPGSTITDKIVPLGPLSVTPSPGGLNFVPTGFPGAGQFKLVSWSGGQFYTLTFSPDGAGTFNITAATLETTIVGGPEGFIYVPPGSPQFQSFNAMLVSEYSAGMIAAYNLDANGDPVPATRQTFISGLTGAEGAALDPLTGDFVFSTYGGGNQVAVVRGFTSPSVDLSVSKVDTPDPVALGGTVTYTLTVGNNGPGGATNVTLTDTLPASATFVLASPSQGTCTGTATVTCALGTLASAATATVTIVVTPTAAGTLTNTASVSATEFDPNAANNSATSTTSVTTVNDFTLVVLPTIATVRVGQSVGYLAVVIPKGSFNSSVSFSCSHLPLGTFCSFSPSFVVPGANPAFVTLTVSTTPRAFGFFPGTPRGIFLFRITATSASGLQRSAVAVLNVQ